MASPAVPPPTAVKDRSPVMALSAAAPLRVDGASGGWLVENGEVDLFAAALDGGEPGRRYSLCSFGAGAFLLSLPSADDHAIIAVGRGGASVRLLGDDDLAALLRERGEEHRMLHEAIAFLTAAAHQRGEQ